MGSSTAGMEVTCKTLENQRKFKLKLQEGARVLDLVEKLKCELGESNDYRCVCLGKLMRDCDSLSHYTISEILPIIVMITDRQEILRQQQQIREIEEHYSHNVHSFKRRKIGFESDFRSG